MKLEFTTRVREVQQRLKGLSEKSRDVVEHVSNVSGSYDTDEDGKLINYYPWVSLWLDDSKYIGQFKIGDSIKVTIEHV